MNNVFTPQQEKIIQDICLVQLGSFERVFVSASQRDPQNTDKLRELGVSLEKWLDEIGNSTLEFQKLQEDTDYILEMPAEEFNQLLYIFNQLKRYYVDATPKTYNNVKNKLIRISKIHNHEEELP